MSSIEYDFCGLLISSPLDLYGLRRSAIASPATVDVTISLTFGAIPPRQSVRHAWQGRFGLILEGDAATGWIIRCGDDLAIVCDAAGTTLDCRYRDADDIPLLGEILSRRILPRLTSLHRRLPIHAAALARRDDAVLLFGASGAGKSTLTAAMATAGWDIMSDDMTVLTGVEDARVWQSAPGVSLWEASRLGLALPDTNCRAIEGYAGKYWCAPPHRARPGTVPVGAMVFLSFDTSCDAIEWRPISGPTAMVMAASQMVRFDPADKGENTRMLDSIGRLVRRIPCYTFTYPRIYAALPRTIEAITAIQDHAREQAEAHL